MIHLRPDQQPAYMAVREALRRHRSVLLQYPTGGGKTAIASVMARTASDKGRRVYFICHRVELITQTMQTFDKAGIAYGVISAQFPYHSGHNVYIAGIDTLVRRLDKVPVPDLVVWDEAHHITAGTWARTKAHYDTAFHVGLSATPHRLDGQGLKGHFSHMVLGPTVADLIEQGRLADYDLYAPSTPDMTGIHTKMGDYAKGEVASLMDTKSIIGNIVGHWIDLAGGRKTIGFAASISHSLHMVEAFRARGIKAAHLDGGTSPQERRSTAEAFAKGDIDVLWNVALFGEGYDLAAQANMPVTVDCVIQARPTQSLSLHLQQVGRALRPKQGGSKAVILDHAGNAMRHGLPDDDREWSLDGRPKGGDKEATAPVRQCPKCYYVFKPTAKCPACGYEIPVKARELNEQDGKLEKIDKDAMRREHKREQTRAESLDALVALGIQRGYKNPQGWAAHVWTARQARGRV